MARGAKVTARMWFRRNRGNLLLAGVFLLPSLALSFGTACEDNKPKLPPASVELRRLARGSPRKTQPKCRNPYEVAVSRRRMAHEPCAQGCDCSHQRSLPHGIYEKSDEKLTSFNHGRSPAHVFQSRPSTSSDFWDGVPYSLPGS